MSHMLLSFSLRLRRLRVVVWILHVMILSVVTMGSRRRVKLSSEWICLLGMIRINSEWVVGMRLFINLRAISIGILRLLVLVAMLHTSCMTIVLFSSDIKVLVFRH